MPDHTRAGREGEKEVVAQVPCPNCGKPLMMLPPNYPMYDVQCTGCAFRAQVKTNNTKPKAEIFGAGWDIIEKVTKAGYVVPPLIAYFKWTEHDIPCREIRFYPFIPRGNLRKHQLSATARRPMYKMFNYVGLDHLPHFVLRDSTWTAAPGNEKDQGGTVRLTSRSTCRPGPVTGLARRKGPRRVLGRR